jgi:predicted ribosomally synthesized peptide with nif11-like leader
MSKENLEQFMNQIAESEELQAKIGEEIDAESLIALGAENGCEFTEEDIQESAELSDEELDGVAGGMYPRLSPPSTPPSPPSSPPGIPIPYPTIGRPIPPKPKK